MTARLAAVSLLALVGLSAPAFAAGSCQVAVMGLTVDQCRPDAARLAPAPYAEAVTPAARPTAAPVATGSIERRSNAR